ncbi:MFS transporter [Paenibacillus lacisoli]|uniref:MFS transporter n=1 Tax=Paenibacillus lacisoli TaxID=3064525 RepID=UPI00387E6C2E
MPNTVKQVRPAVKPRPRRRLSVQRRQIRIATWEGVPSTIFQTLLGGPFLTGFLLYLGASSSQIGFVLAITTFVNIAQLGIAYGIQRIRSRKWTLIWFLTIHRLLWAGTGLIPFIFPKDLWVSVYIATYTVAFAANAVASMLWTSLISDIVPARVRGRHFGIRNTILNALGSLCLFTGGILLDRFPGGTGFLLLFIPIWICSVANIIIYFYYPDLPFERSQETSFWPMLRRPLQDAGFMKATAFLASWLLVQTLVVPLFSYAMLDLMHVNYKTISIITVMQTLAMMASFYIWGNLNARYSNKKLLFWTLPIIAASCLSWGLLAILPILLVLVLSHVLLGIGVGGFNQLAFNFTIGDTPKSERPMFIAMYSALTGLTSFVGPLAGGRIYGWMKAWPSSLDWFELYGFPVSIGFIMLILTGTLGRRILLAS